MKKIFCLLFMIGFSFSGLAADGSSGCGPGWYVAKKNSLLSSSIRATTNGILAPSVTFGMTFGTSNCTKHSIVKRENESLKFATDNYFEIATQSATGSGDFLSVYAETIGCSKDSTKEFGVVMKKNFNKLFPNLQQSPKALLNQTIQIIFENKNLRNSCLTTA